MRLINADELAEIFANRMEIIAERYGVYSSESGILSGAYKLLQLQHTIEPEQRWISVTEKLPKKAGNYLVTYHNGDIAICLYLDSEKSKDYWMRYVKAWMPLPEPWKGE